jgi:hypothetical protein
MKAAQPSDVIEGEFEVIEPRPAVSWSFWTDDLPVIVKAVVGMATAVWVYDWAQRLFS